MRTRVGYTGGEKDHPTYHDLGRHTEAIQIDYDPETISYGDLLDVYWQSHRPVGPSWSIQYASFVFVHDPAQRRVAGASIKEIEERWGKKVSTRIRAADTFWRAEDYHQKYRLRGHKPLMAELRTLFPDERAFTDATVTARLNGLLMRDVKLAALDAEASGYGLPDGAWSRLRALVQ